MATIRKRGKTYQIDYFDPNGKRIRKSFKRKKDAEAQLGKRVSLITEGRYLDVKKEYLTTFDELAAKYKENYKHQSSYKSAKGTFIANFKEHFGNDRLLTGIRYVDLESYRTHLRNKLTRHKTIRTVATINREISCLRHIFGKALEWQMIDKSPFDTGKSLILKENNARMRFLTEDEIQTLLDNCPVYLRRIVETVLNTGMRRSEVLSLKWNQVRNGFIYLTKTKTNDARQIPINDALVAVFRAIRKDQQLTSQYVFTYQGKPVQDVKIGLRAALKKPGIEDFRFHDLRHTFASQMVMRGASLRDVQEILGHKTMTMTLRYAHLSQEHKRKAINLLNGLTAPKNPTCHKTVTKEKPAVLATG